MTTSTNIIQIEHIVLQRFDSVRGQEIYRIYNTDSFASFEIESNYLPQFIKDYSSSLPKQTLSFRSCSGIYDIHWDADDCMIIDDTIIIGDVIKLPREIAEKLGASLCLIQ